MDAVTILSPYGSTRGRLMQLTESLEFISLETPTIDQLINHAAKFGTHQVVETAIQLGYSYEAVCRLQRQCDVIERDNYAREHHGSTTSYGGPRQSVDKRVKKLMGITDEEIEDATKTA